MTKFVGTVECGNRNEFEDIMNIRINRGERIVSTGRTGRGVWWALLEWEDDDD